MTQAEVPNFDDRLADFHSPSFTQLRPGQREVLSAYGQHHLDTSDVAIEMPTGEGKTLVALLIADYALDQGLSVAYLTGTRHLAEQVQEEADKLGLDAVRFAGKNYGAAKLDDYHQAQAVAVAVANAARNAIEASPLASDETFEKYEAAELRTVKNEADEVKAEVKKRTDEVKKLKDEIKWVWPKIREHLTRCGVLIGPSGIEIRPYHPPTALNAGYSQARQRIYLSATLGSMDDLQRRVGGGKVTRLVTEQPLPTGSTGERMFVLNPSQKKALDPAVIAWAVEQTIAAGGRAAWLCASHPEADDVQMLLTGFGHDVYRLRAGDDSGVDAWSRAPLGHLVTAGRYDGLDLAGDVCKLVVITTVPQSSSEFERLGVNLVVVTPDNVLTLNEVFAA